MHRSPNINLIGSPLFLIEYLGRQRRGDSEALNNPTSPRSHPSIHRAAQCGQAAPAPSSVDAMMMTRTSAAMRAKSGSRWKRNHVPIVATRTVGRTISRTIPVETRCSASDRALALNTGNAIPAAMNPHDAQVPKPRSCARRLFKRSGTSGLEIVTLATLHERQSP
jgi:hypothetical protein